MKNEDEDIFNQIKKIREQNNSNWMELLKLAFRADPYNAKIIMRNIVECDEKIKNLCKELIE